MASDTDINSEDESSPDSNLTNELLSPGEKFGDHQVMQCLSYDVLGGLYRMQNIKNFEEVCITVLPQKVRSATDFKERFAAVGEKLKNLQHPNLLQTTGYGLIDNRYVLIMEPFAGANMVEYLETFSEERLKSTEDKVPDTQGNDKEVLADQEFGLPAQEIKNVLKQASEALHVAHLADVTHLNLNPTSLIRASDGQVKITGLGLSEIFGLEQFNQIVSSGVPAVQIGPQNALINTREALSPEVLDGKLGDVNSDFYGLGFCAYYLLTGKKPVKDRAPASTFSARIPQGWDQIINRCLNETSSKRYINALALVSDLDKVDRASAPGKGSGGTFSRHIEKIPLPKSLERRLDPKKLKLIRLCILGAFAFFIVRMATYSYSVIFTEEKSATERIVWLAEVGEEPDFKMFVLPQIAKVTFKSRGNSAYFILSDGTLNVNMQPDNYAITVEANNHKPRMFQQQIGDDQMNSLRVALRPVWAVLELSGKAGTSVQAINEKDERFELGLIPDSGILRIEELLISGNYKLVFSLNNYKTLTTENILLPFDELKEYEAVLEPVPGTLKILSQPSGAIVMINGDEMGKTPLEKGDIPIGVAMTISLTHEKYRSLEKQIELSPGQEEVVDFGSMARITGTLYAQFTIDAKAPPPEVINKLAIRIAGEKFTGRNKFTENIVQGDHTLEVEHPDYNIWRGRVEINDKRGTQVKVNLESRPGILTFDLTPSLPFALLVDRRKVEVQDNVIAFRPDRDYELEIHIKDHLTAKRRVVFKPNEKQTWSATLVPISGPEKNKAWQVPYLGLNLNWIAAGSLRIGSELTEESRLATEGPRTTITISQGFWMAKNEVTQIQYLKVMEEKPSKFRGTNHPVDSVTWDKAMAFCKKVTEQERVAGRLPEGFIYRLPTEAEWEYACRAGTETPYAFGDRADPNNGNFKGGYPREYAESLSSDDIYGSREVGHYEPNAWGLFDMHGNVSEWCYDRFNSRYPGGVKTDYAGPESGTDHVLRGGGWEDFAHHCRSSSRNRRNPSTISASTGFRYVLAPSPKMGK